LSDRYRAIQLIGQGTYGKTFVAIDEHRPSKPKCIIKQLIGARGHQPSPEDSTQFCQEAERLEKLGQHPRIPALWAFFEHNEHRYLIQEFIDGISLETQLQSQGAFSEAQIRAILHDVLPILQFIHIHQIIHRDIKAQNLVYATQPHSPRDDRADSNKTPGIESLMLVDFGTAKFATATNLLQVGTMIGGEGYGPPEQAIGRATFSSDLYSLGVTCIHLLTNEPLLTLFNAKTQKWEWEPHLKGNVSGELSQILNQLLQRELRHRYKSANEVLDAVTQNLSGVSGRPTFVPPPKSPLRQSTDFAASSATPQSESSTWRCVHTLRGHQAWVRSVALSPDGTLLASGSGDKTVKLWSVARGQLLHTLTGHSTWGRGVAISPDQRLVVSVSNDKTIRLWHSQTGAHQQTLTGHSDWIRSATFLPLDNILATAGQDKIIHLWDLKRCTILRTLKGHTHWVLALAAHPDGKRLFSGSRDRTIRCWNITTGKCEGVLLGHTSEVSGLTINSTGDRLLSCSADQTIRLWDTNSGQLLQTLRGHGGAVNSVAFHPNSQDFASGSSDKTIKLWNLASNTPYATLTGHAGWVWAVAFPSRLDGTTSSLPLISGSWDGTINIWQQHLGPS
jgi:WD40 repeat protein